MSGCINHWHCDPSLASHVCISDRDAPCPNCGAETLYRVCVFDADGQPGREYAAPGVTIDRARAYARALCGMGFVGGSVVVVDTTWPAGHPLRSVARFDRSDNRVVEVNP